MNNKQIKKNNICKYYNSLKKPIYNVPDYFIAFAINNQAAKLKKPKGFFNQVPFAKPIYYDPLMKPVYYNQQIQSKNIIYYIFFTY